MATGNDDGYGFTSSGTNYIYFSGSETLNGNYGGTVCRSWVRFSAVNVPKDATILSAKLQLRAGGPDFYNDDDTCNLKVHLEQADNPATPSSGNDLFGRTIDSGVAWDAVAHWTAGTWYESPDITSLIQSIVNRAGWADGQAMIVHILDNGSSLDANRSYSTYNAGASYAAKLFIQYSEE